MSDVQCRTFCTCFRAVPPMALIVRVKVGGVNRHGKPLQSCMEALGRHIRWIYVIRHSSMVPAHVVLVYGR